MQIHTNTSVQRMLISGGAGFIGSHLAEALLARGNEVTIIDDLSTGRFENIAHLVPHPRFHFTIDDVRNEVVLDRLASQAHVIFHLAAAVGVMLIIEKPVHTIETNLSATEAVLKAARRYRAKVLLASTSEVYGKRQNVPFREDEDVILGPSSRARWAYAASKLMDEFMALAYWREYSLPVVIFRLFNTVGARQVGAYGMVVPRFVQQALQAQPLTIFGDGKQARCFLHVQDAVEGIIRLSEIPAAVGEVFNIGSTQEISILDLARHTLAAVNKEAQLPPVNDERLRFIPYAEAYTESFDDMQRRVPDLSKMHTASGWQAQHTLADILQDVIDDLRLSPSC